MSVFDRLRKTALSESVGAAIPAISATAGPDRQGGAAQIAGIAKIAGDTGLKDHPPPLSADDVEALTEARAERSAICELDGGLSRRKADTEAAKIRAYSVLVAMPDGGAPRWVTMIGAHGIEDAKRLGESTFGLGLVLDVRKWAQ